MKFREAITTLMGERGDSDGLFELKSSVLAACSELSPSPREPPPVRSTDALEPARCADHDIMGRKRRESAGGADGCTAALRIDNSRSPVIHRVGSGGEVEPSKTGHQDSRRETCSA
jgi:hypothetical protein